MRTHNPYGTEEPTTECSTLDYSHVVKAMPRAAIAKVEVDEKTNLGHRLTVSVFKESQHPDTNDDGSHDWILVAEDLSVEFDTREEVQAAVKAINLLQQIIG